MKTYTITRQEGDKLLLDCVIWFNGNIDLLAVIRWIASRCKAPTLSANVKLEATADYLTKYYDVTGFKI